MRTQHMGAEGSALWAARVKAFFETWMKGDEMEFY